MKRKMGITVGDKEKAELIELRSEQLRDILGQVPKWVLRNGTIIIFLVLFFLLIGSAILKYPDVIGARIVLTTETPPADVVAKTSARIMHLMVKDKDFVDEKQVLAVLESATSYKDVITLLSLLRHTFYADSLISKTFPDNLQLGAIQDNYAEFQKRMQEYRGFLQLDYYNRKINSIQAELVKYSLFLERLKEQELVLQRDYSLAAKQYERDSLLFTDRVISSSQLEKSETQKLSKLYEWKETQTKLASAEIDVSNLQQEILELELKLEENSRQHIQRLREAYERLKGRLALWEEEHIIYSPFNGQVSFTRIWSTNQYVENGQTVVTVVPQTQGAIIGKAELDASGAGKVEEGHKVVIRFDNFPFMEFGTVSGKISSISLVPNQNQYSAEIRLDSTKLITNYGVELTFHQNMPGLAEIITEQRTLLQRITDPFRSAANRQKILREQ